MKKMVAEAVNTSKAVSNSRDITMDVVTSISANGKVANTLTHNNGERRDVVVTTPYGIASAPLDGMAVQIVVNDMNNRSCVVGVNDPNKPDVPPGCMVLYTKHGSRIEMLVDGGIRLVSASGKSITVDEICDHISNSNIHN